MKRSLNHICCVDDDPDILEVVKLTLESVGKFKVSTCTNGLEATQNMHQFMPDLILLDVMMPEMDGPTALKYFQEDIKLRDIPVIFMTARVQPKEVDEYLRIGATGVIIKPFDPMKLPSEITEIWQDYIKQQGQ